VSEHPFQPEKAIREARERERGQHGESGLLLDILSETGQKLSQVLDSLDLLHAKVDKVSQDQSHLEADMSALGSALDGLAADFAAEVQALKDAQAANPGQPLDFTSADAVVARAQQMAADEAPAAPPADGSTPPATSDPGTGADVPPAS
jgi:hypothetical protein